MAHARGIGPAVAITGAVLLFVGTSLHPHAADPNAAPAAFAEYAADRHWIASHLLQLAGIVLMLTALVLLARTLADGAAAPWAALGMAGTAASLALASALQAVDGVALKKMVHAWAAAPEADKAALFQAAFAVRQVEIGLASIGLLIFGLTAPVYGIAMVVDGRLPKWLGLVAIAAGGGMVAAGLAIAYSGFSPAASTITHAASFLLLAWMVALGVYGWRHSTF